MNKKGFTLTELLVVIVIMGIVTGLSIPLIRGLAATFEERKYTNYVNTVLSAAKLYNDSYSEDIFGRKEYGCGYVTYNQMVDKDLLKDISIDDVSCATDGTFVQITKIGEKYGYKAVISCGDKVGNQIKNIKAHGEVGLTINHNACTGSEDNNISIKIDNSDAKTTYDKKKRTTHLILQSGTGIKNASISYAWSKTKDAYDGADWKSLNITIPSNQTSTLIGGNLVTANSSNLTTPKGTGIYYLLVRVNNLSDLNGSNWQNKATVGSNNVEYTRDNYISFGKFAIDNTKPTIKVDIYKCKVENGTRVKDGNILNTETVTNDKAIDMKDYLSSSYESGWLKKEDFPEGVCFEYGLSDNALGSRTWQWNAGGATANQSGYKTLPEGNISSKTYGNGVSSDTHNAPISGYGHRYAVLTITDKAGNATKLEVDVKIRRTSTLTYDSKGGSSCSAKKVTYIPGVSTKWGTLCTPTKTGYTFSGWVSANTGEGVTANTVITGDDKVEAQWTPHKVRIKMNANGGSLASTHGDGYTVTSNVIKHNNSDIIHTINYGSKLSTDGLLNYNNSSALNLVKTGYNPTAWNTKADGTGTSFNQNDQYNASDFCDASNADCTVTLYVKWALKTRTVTFHRNTSSTDTSTAQETFTYSVANQKFGYKTDGTCRYSNCYEDGFGNWTKTGYTLSGWAKTAGGAVYYDTYSGVTDSWITAASTQDLYAVWTPKNYYLDLNGILDGTNSGSISGYGTADVYINGKLEEKNTGIADYYTQHPYGTTYEIKNIKATTGHTYDGVGEGSIKGTITGNTGFRLKFHTNDTVTITYNANGGSGAPGNQQYIYDNSTPVTSINLSSTKPTKKVTVTYDLNGTGATKSGGDSSASYTFNAWTWNGNSYTPGQKWNRNNPGPTYNLVAKWNSVSITLPTIKKYGYTCKWTTPSGSGTAERASGGSWTFDSATTRTFTAVCTANTYTITLNLNGAQSGPTSTKISYGATKFTDSPLTQPTKKLTVTYDLNGTGATISRTKDEIVYAFNAWYTDEDDRLTNKAGDTFVQNLDDYTNSSRQWVKAENTTIYAQYASYTLVLPTVTKSGYNCVWTTNDGKSIRESGGEWEFTSATSRTFKASCTATSTPVPRIVVTSSNTYSANSRPLKLMCTDKAGVTAYYWGTTKPTAASSCTTTTNLSTLTGSGISTSKTAGTYYLACRNASGNWAFTSITIKKKQCYPSWSSIPWKAQSNLSSPYTSCPKDHNSNSDTVKYKAMNCTSGSAASSYSECNNNQCKGSWGGERMCCLTKTRSSYDCYYNE